MQIYGACETRRLNVTAQASKVVATVRDASLLPGVVFRWPTFLSIPVFLHLLLLLRQLRCSSIFLLILLHLLSCPTAFLVLSIRLFILFFCFFLFFIFFIGMNTKWTNICGEMDASESRSSLHDSPCHVDCHQQWIQFCLCSCVCLFAFDFYLCRLVYGCKHTAMFTYAHVYPFITKENNTLCNTPI